MPRYKVKAEVLLTKHTTIEARDHIDVKKKLENIMIREGYDDVSIKYIKSELIKEDPPIDDYPDF